MYQHQYWHRVLVLKYRVLSRRIGIEVLILVVLMVPWDRGIGIVWYCSILVLFGIGNRDSGLDKHRYRIELSILKSILLKFSLITCYAKHYVIFKTKLLKDKVNQKIQPSRRSYVNSKIMISVLHGLFDQFFVIFFKISCCQTFTHRNGMQICFSFDSHAASNVSSIDLLKV